MQENLKSDIIIRDMQDSDVSFIILSAKEQGKSLDVEKFYNRLEEKSKGKNFALVAEYKGEIAGYVFVYPFSQTGLFKNEDYTEIVDFTIFKKYKDLGIEDKLLDAAVEIASNYSDITYISISAHDLDTLNLCVKHEFVIHKSGLHKNSTYHDCSADEENLAFWLFKNLDVDHIHRFLITNTFKRPYLEWYQKGLKKAFCPLNHAKSQRIKIGDEIVLTNRRQIAYVKGIVTFKHEYKTAREMLQSEGVHNLLPFLSDNDLEKAVQEYQNIPEYNCVDEFGCVAFGLQIVESKL